MGRNTIGVSILVLCLFILVNLLVVGIAMPATGVYTVGSPLQLVPYGEAFTLQLAMAFWYFAVSAVMLSLALSIMMKVISINRFNRQRAAGLLLTTAAVFTVFGIGVSPLTLKSCAWVTNLSLTELSINLELLGQVVYLWAAVPYFVLWATFLIIAWSAK